jgi:integrase
MQTRQTGASRSSQPADRLLDLLLLASLLQPQGTQAEGSGTRGRGPGKENPQRARQRALTLKTFVQEKYLTERRHPPQGPTATLAMASIDQLSKAIGREPLLRDLCYPTLETFRTFLQARIAAGLSPATANLHLRQLRAIWNHAARWQRTAGGRKWRAVRPAEMTFFAEAEPDVVAWTAAELDAIEQQARTLTGAVGKEKVPADVFWTAWVLVLRSLGCRITAMMLCERQDYDPTCRALLLRRENQKQHQDQRIALPPRAAAAVERLLQCHGSGRIFGCWPFEPPDKGTGRPKWRVLVKHFSRRLVVPAGLKLPRGVKTRQFRRTAATILEEHGGNAQELLGHADRKTTERYKDRRRRPICRQSLLMPEAASPQKRIF